MRTRAITVLAAVLLAGASHSALAQTEGSCRGDARNLDRELTLRSGQMSAHDRVLAEQRLGRASGLCAQDSGRGSAQLEELRRDMVQQALKPPLNSPSGVPGAPRH